MNPDPQPRSGRAGRPRRAEAHTAATAVDDAPAIGTVARVEAWALRAPIATPVSTSFGTMRDRPAVLVRVTGHDGACGWGEVWCNFPGVGAEHRARLLVDTVAPLALRGCAHAAGALSPPALWRALTAQLHVLALQTGEPGPLAQCVAGIDQACWDLVARRAGLPLWQVLGPGGDARARDDQPDAPRVRVYASGLHPDAVLDRVPRLHDTGHRAFKMKVGFDADADARRLAELRRLVGADTVLMVDANQAWSPQEAADRIARLAPMRPRWVEEPIAADQGWDSWQRLARALDGDGPQLAAGENLRGEDAFDALIASGAIGVVQPDIGKWGGLSACRAVAMRAEARGRVFCPHWLGGPIGLLGSMHLRAALDRGRGRVHPEGLVEWDANPNPLHGRVSDQLPPRADGWAQLSHRPGLGLDPDTAIDRPGEGGWGDLIRWRGAAGI